MCDAVAVDPSLRTTTYGRRNDQCEACARRKSNQGGLNLFRAGSTPATEAVLVNNRRFDSRVKDVCGHA